MVVENLLKEDLMAKLIGWNLRVSRDVCLLLHMERGIPMDVRFLLERAMLLLK